MRGMVDNTTRKGGVLVFRNASTSNIVVRELLILLSNFGVDEMQSSAEPLFSGKMNINIKLERNNKMTQTH